MERMAAGLFHAINHTLFKGLLFLVAGAVQHETGTLDLDKMGGLAKKMPKTTVLFLIGAASISGIPPFNGFASKWMIYQAIFGKAIATNNFFFVIVCVVALITSVLTLASFVKVAQSVFFGQMPPRRSASKPPRATLKRSRRISSGPSAMTKKTTRKRTRICARPQRSESCSPCASMTTRKRPRAKCSP